MRSSLVSVPLSLALAAFACASPKSGAPQAEEAPGQPTSEAQAQQAGAAKDAASLDAEAPEAEPSPDAVNADPPPPSPDDYAGAMPEPDLEQGKKSKESRRADDVQVAIPALNGGLNRDIIRRKVSDHSDDVRSCYGRGLDANAELGGALVIAVEIDGDGRVTETKLAEANAVMNKQVQDCVLELVEGWSFDAPKRAKPTTAELSFSLQ